MILAGADENHIGRVKMQRAAKSNLILTTGSSFTVLGGTYQAIEREELYQHITFALLRGVYRKQLADVGNELIVMADHALGLRQVDVAERISEVLLLDALFAKPVRRSQVEKIRRIWPIFLASRFSYQCVKE